jgi:transcriptional regulator with XRE-family HTH domain
MANPIKINELAALLKSRRGGLGLREAAEEIGDVSASTLSRIEQGKVPDLETFVKVCRWLGEPTERFLEPETNSGKKEGKTEDEEIIMAHLRADKLLDPQTKNSLEHLIRMAYLAAKEAEKKQGRKA